jgi:hypothetical protein
MLIPLSIASIKGLLLPVVFSVATALPVIIIAFFVAFTLSGISKFYQNARIFELWFRRLIAVVFMVSGCYFIYIYWFI